jgi:hypothetical protein
MAQRVVSMSNTHGFRYRGAGSLILSAALAALIGLSSPTVVKAQDDPKRGAVPEMIYAQRDGMISDIYVKVGD